MGLRVSFEIDGREISAIDLPFLEAVGLERPFRHVLGLWFDRVVEHVAVVERPAPPVVVPAPEPLPPDAPTLADYAQVVQVDAQLPPAPWTCGICQRTRLRPASCGVQGERSYTCTRCASEQAVAESRAPKLAEPAAPERTTIKAQILAVLRRALDRGFKSVATHKIAAEVPGATVETIRAELTKMANAGNVVRLDRGVYALPGVTP